MIFGNLNWGTENTFAWKTRNNHGESKSGITGNSKEPGMLEKYSSIMVNSQMTTLSGTGSSVQLHD